MTAGRTLRRAASRVRHLPRRARRTRILAVPLPHGGTLRWPEDDRYPSAMADGTYEPELLAQLADRLRPGDHVLDIGANSGYLSFVCRALVGPSGRVVAVEPHPENLLTLRTVQALNPNLPIDVVPVAVAATRGTATLHLTHNLANGHLEHAGWSHTKPTVAVLEVTSRSLDDLVAQVEPALVKIDIEGAEAAVLEASAGPLRWPTLPVVLVEYHGRDNRDRCLAVARSWGWRVEDSPADDGLDAGLLTLEAPA